MTNAARTVTERTDYEPFGLMVNGQPDDRPAYAGHVSDAATGMSYMQQRYYDPEIGRFLSVDPVSALVPGNFNRYSYAANNPYRFVDPDGRFKCTRDGGTCDKGDAKKAKALIGELKRARRSSVLGAARSRINSILGRVGDLWDGKHDDVVINFTSLDKDVFGDQSGTFINIDDKQISNFAGDSLFNFFGASVLLHEGSHLLDSERPGFKGNAYPSSRLERLLTEIRAYGIESAFHNISGMRSAINAPGMTDDARAAAILNAAQADVRASCKKGGWGC
jgi:RHS repeat-associated protein